MALPCVTLGGGSRKRLGVWLLGKFRILEATETLQVVAASRNVRGSRPPPRHADYGNRFVFKDRFFNPGRSKAAPQGRRARSRVNLPFVICHFLHPSLLQRFVDPFCGLGEHALDLDINRFAFATRAFG